MPSAMIPGLAATLLLLTGSPACLADEPAAAPVHRSAAHHTGTRHRRHIPAPAAHPVADSPSQPAAPPASGPAPVPNEAVNAPIDNTQQETSVAPSVFQLHYPPQGDGYTRGSTSQALDDREAAKATGVEVKVPLPQ